MLHISYPLYFFLSFLYNGQIHNTIIHKGVLMSLKRKIINYWKNCSIFLCIQKIINSHFIKKLHNQDFTILCPNCIGGCIYHRLEQQFRSPTVNCFMKTPDFVPFCLYLDYYLEQELHFVESSTNYPVAQLEGNGEIPTITIHFNHNDCEEGARNDWNRRKARINKENLYIILYMTDGVTIEEVKKLDPYPCNNKVVFSSKPVPEISWSFYIEPNFRSQYPYAYLGKDAFGIRDYEKKFDFVGFLNRK